MNPYNYITPERHSAETPETSIEQHGKPLSEAMPSDAIHPVKITANTATADVVRQQPQAGQSNASIPVTSTAPTANAVSARIQTDTAKTSATHPGQPDVVPPVQAAQLGHTSTTPCATDSNEPPNCAPAGGNFPQAPGLDPKLESWNPRQESLGDRLSTRCTNSECDIVAERMARTGENQSEAIRAIIRQSQCNTGNVYPQSKGTPKELEALLGTYSKWRHDMAKARPRLNVPTPANDDPRYKEVTEWRLEANRVLNEIPQLEEAAEAALTSLTSLTPAKIAMLKKQYPLYKAWKKIREEKKDDVAAEAYGALIALIEDMGIVESSVP